MIIREQISYVAQLRRKPTTKNGKKPYWVVEDLVDEKTWNVEAEQACGWERRARGIAVEVNSSVKGSWR